MKTNIMASALCAVLLVLHGCGGGGSETPSVSTTLPTVIAMTPANNAVMVNAQSNIELTFSKSLDATTVNRETVRLRFKTALGDNGTLPTSVTYDDITHKVIIKPATPLRGIKLTLTLSGIKDLAGNAIIDTTYSMHSYLNPRVLEVSHNSTTGAIIGYYRATYANNLQTFLGGYNSAGADLTWLNTDDLVFSWQQYAYNPDNMVSRIISGPNSSTVTSYVQATYNANTELIRLTRYANDGVDNIWATADDTVDGYTAYSYDAWGNLLRATNYTGIGADQAWNTSDDFFSSDSSYTYDTSGNLLRARKTNAGTDGAWNTSDDVNYAVTYDHDASGNITREVIYLNAGPDTLWFTADDPVAGYLTYNYHINSQPAQKISYTAAGTDGAWFTADDTVSSYIAYSYSPQGNHTQSIVYSESGTDNNWFTGDDVIVGYATNAFDGLNNQTNALQFSGNGPDAIWFTTDDIHSLSIAYDTTF